MSMKRFGKAALRIGHEFVARAGGSSSLWTRLFPRIFPSMYNLGVRVALRRPPVPKSYFLRASRLILRNNRLYRPFTSLAIERHRFNSSRFHTHKFRPYVVRQATNKDMMDSIKDIFAKNARYNEDLRSSELPNTIGAYEFGDFLGQGCNAAVYEARLAEEHKQSIGPGFNEVSKVLACKPPTSRSGFRMQAYPYAIKLMFNYDHETLGEDHLWKEMGTELAPYPNAKDLLRGNMSNFKPLPKRHPNVVRIMTAFVDSLVVRPDAIERYPDALHTARWYTSINNNPKTMYIIMRRYRQTLNEYVATHHRNYWTGRVMLAQLLEALAFLQDNFVSQRDMKSDNILLQYDDDDDIPHLVISDFGCALACGSWKVEYENKDVYLGGNAKTRAPEIATAVPGENVFVDFRMADTWAAGGLGYEMFTRVNPFYSQLSSENYLESDLPKLPKKLHAVAKEVVSGLLRRDPEQRLSPHIAATALNISLFRFGEDVQHLLNECGIKELASFQKFSVDNTSRILKKLGENANKALDNVMSLLTAETIAAHLSPHLVTRAERQLRATFLSRVRREDLWSAMNFFFADTNVVSADSLASITSNLNSLCGSDGLASPPKGKSKLFDISENLNGIVHRVRSK